MPKKKETKKIEFNSLEERKTALQRVMKDINKSNKTQTLMFANLADDLELIPTGAPCIDELIGGLPKGNFVTIWGDAGTGKSTSCYYAVAQIQKSGGIAVYLDLEQKFSPDRAVMCGVNLEELVLMTEVNNAEEAMEVIRKLSKERVVDLIVVDSIQGMAPKGQKQKKSGVDKNLSENTIGILARKMSDFFKVVANDIALGNVAVLLVGQARTGGIGTFYVRDVLSGGRAIEFWSRGIIRLRRGQQANAPKESIQEGDKKVTKSIGFELVAILEKTQIKGSKTEKTEVHLPYYYKTAFKQPKGLKNAKKSK